MATKYLNLEEAAEVLGVEAHVLNQLRENGKIRAFADRGSWKFRPDDIENLKRSQQFGSSLDVPLGDLPDDSDFDATAVEPDSGADMVGEDSGEDLLLGEEDSDSVLDEKSTIVRRRGGGDSSSDSDVKLVFDDALLSEDGSSGEILLSSLSDSDSDVRLTADSSADTSSDSDVKLVGGSSVEIDEVAGSSDSDVSLVGGSSDAGASSDSDVSLAGGSSDAGASSDSDVSLAGGSSDEGTSSDSDVQLIQTSENEAEHFVAAPLDSGSEYAIDIIGDSDGSSVLADGDSSLSPEEDSGISLQADSGLSLASDSGISLADDSGLSLAGDSGISLASDSGLSLAGDSGISLSVGDDSGLTLDGDKDKTDAFSTMDVDGGLLVEDGEETHDTHLDVPAVVDDESDFEFSTNLLDADSETGVVSIDDDVSDELSVFDTSEEPVIFETGEEPDEYEESESLDFEDEGFDEDAFTDGDEMDDLIGVGEEDFDESMLTGESQSGFAMPSGRMVKAVEQDWGTVTHVGLWFGSLVMVVGLLMMFDVVRTMWGDTQADSLVNAGGLINAISDMF